MKIVRFISDQTGPDGAWGKIGPDNTVTICTGDPLGGLSDTDATVAPGEIKKYLPPVDAPNVIAIGANYVDHCSESDVKPPDHPLVFIKATSSVIAHGEKIELPRDYPDVVDYEAELALVIGKAAKHVKASDACDYILGYTCANDVSARDVQIKIDSQWARGKSFDTFCPLGPWLETEMDPSDVRVKMRINGEEMQNQSSADMIFSIPTIIEFLSAGMTLLPGTVILTGTPSGVGFARDPQVLLKSGDVAEVEVEGIGVLKNTVA